MRMTVSPGALALAPLERSHGAARVQQVVAQQAVPLGETESVAAWAADANRRTARGDRRKDLAMVEPVHTEVRGRRCGVSRPNFSRPRASTPSSPAARIPQQSLATEK